MERGVAASQLVSVHYAPFDYLNRDARVIILGITPGRQQARMATERFGARLRAGDTLKDALRSAKGYASFGGDMRSRLVRMLDRFRVNAYLGIASCASLWSGDEHLAQFCSGRSEEHTSELQSLMRNSYAVFCLKKKTSKQTRLTLTSMQ